MDVELIEIRDFLANHPPFGQLPDEVLDRLPKELSVRYLRRGTPFPPADADGDYLYIVRRGAVDLRDTHQRLVAKFGEGDIYSSNCLKDNPESTFSGTTAEDTLFYLLPCPQLAALRSHHATFDEHFNQSIRERLRRALDTLQGPIAGGLMAVEVAQLINRPAVGVGPEISIRAAAEIMTRERVSSLLILEDSRLVGIVTDRDLRSRCIAAGLSPNKPVRDIMTRKLHKISKDTPAFEALITMTRLNLHHLPVVDSEGVAGVISTTDLVRHESANAVYLVGDVRKCASVEALTEASAQLPELQIQLIASGASAYHLGQAVSTVADAITCRLNELAQTELGPPPVPYAWLAVGSQARREQTVHSDQDNALLLSDAFDNDRHGAYFQALARFVTDGLNGCGFSYCPGKVMASNPQWRQPYHVWRGYFDGWIRAPEPMALMLANNFFDLRCVYGEETLYDRLRAEVLRQSRENGIFLAYLAANALHNRPPLGFFRNLVLIGEGDHAKTLDLKRRGIIPIVDLARVYALSAGLPEVNTLERLKAATEASSLSADGAANLEDALEFLATIRARHQVRQLRRGEAPDNYLRPTELSPLERNHLKDVFSVIRTVQDALSQRYQGERLL